MVVSIWVIPDPSDCTTPDHSPVQPTVHANITDTSFEWSYWIGHDIKDPILTPTGDIIILNGYDSILYSINTNGKLNFKTEVKGDEDKYSHQPCLMNDGTIIFTRSTTVDMSRSDIVAYSKDGELLWIYTHYSYIESVPAVDTNDNIYIGCQGGLLSLNSKGEYRWMFQTKGIVYNKPLIDDEGRIFFFDRISTDSLPWQTVRTCQLYALDRNGTKMWTKEFKSYNDIIPISQDRMVLAGESIVECVDKNGNSLWAWEYPSDFGDFAIVFGDERSIIVLDDNNGRMASLSQNGDLEWTHEGLTLDLFNRHLYGSFFGHDLIIILDLYSMNYFTRFGEPVLKVPVTRMQKVMETGDGNLIINNDRKLFCIGSGLNEVPVKPMEISWKRGVDDNVIISCKLPDFETYPFISHVNLYKKDNDGNFKHIIRVNMCDSEWDVSINTVKFRDWNADKGGEYDYYCTFENRLGESEPSELIEIDRSSVFGSQQLDLIIPLVISSITLLLVAIALVVLYRIKAKGGKE